MSLTPKYSIYPIVYLLFVNTFYVLHYCDFLGQAGNGMKEMCGDQSRSKSN